MLTTSPALAAPAGSPALAAPAGAGSTPAPVLKKKAGQKWWDWAGEQAREADALEKKGLLGEAEQMRERVLTALLLAWREERELRALEPIVITLQRRLGRSTAAIETALSLIYDIHQADKLSPEQEAQIGKLSTQVSLALRRLRREAKPGDVALCQEPMALRPGVLTLAGPLPGDEVLVLRDRADGGVESVLCPARVEEVRAPAPVAACPACPEEAAPVVVREAVSHWWFTGPGLGLLAVGGVFVGLAVQQNGVAGNIQRRADAAKKDGGALSEEEFADLQLADANTQLFAGIGGALGGVGLAACVTGLIIGLSDEAPADERASFTVTPGGASVTWRFD